MNKFTIDGVKIEVEAIAGLTRSWQIHMPSGPFIFAKNMRDEKESLLLSKVLLKQNQWCFQQCNDPINEWESISSSFIYDAWLSKSVANFPKTSRLIYPTETFFSDSSHPRVSEFYREGINKLVALTNAIGWGCFCGWMENELTKLSKILTVDTIDTYTLEARIKDFSIEQQTYQMRYSELNINEIQVERGVLQGLLKSSSTHPSSAAELERMLIRFLKEAHERQEVQRKLLESITTVFHSIENAHPEFFEAGCAVKILARILGGTLVAQGGVDGAWGEDLLSIYYLARSWNIREGWMEGDQNGSLPFVFSIIVALEVFTEKEGLEALWNLVWHWPQAEKNERGRESFRKLVYQVLKDVSVPFFEIYRKEKNMKEKYINATGRKFYEFLPKELKESSDALIDLLS